MNKEIEERVYTFSKKYKEKYGHRVFKLGLSTGIPCPHKLNNKGCSFCVDNTFIENQLSQIKEIKHQIDFLIKKISSKINKTEKDLGYIAYFQDNTSSYGDTNLLFNKFNQAVKHPKILEIIISTRPDYINTEFLEMIKNLNKPVTIEIGIQSIHNENLELYNRGHTQNDNVNAIELLQKFNINTGAHLIIGSPYDIADNNLKTIETIKWVNRQLIIKDVKLHHLAVFTDAYLKDSIDISKIINLETYLKTLVAIIKILRPDISISRFFTSNLNQHQKMLNDFPGIKKIWLNRLKDLLNQENIYQGQCYTRSYNEYNS